MKKKERKIDRTKEMKKTKTDSRRVTVKMEQEREQGSKEART